MCYLIAKERDAHGCYALKTSHGKHLVELKRELNEAVGYKGVQLVQQKLSNWLYFELLAILVLSDRKRYQYGTFKSNQINS